MRALFESESELATQAYDTLLYWWLWREPWLASWLLCSALMVIAWVDAKLPRTIRFGFQMLGPLLMLIAFIELMGSRHLWDDRGIAMVTYLGCAIGLALHNLHSPPMVIRGAGIVMSTLGVGFSMFLALGCSLSLAGLWADDLVYLVVLGSILVSLVWSVIAYRLTQRYRRTRRLAEGHCVTCDYDLRGSRNTARCPECGAATSRVASPTRAPASSS